MKRNGLNNLQRKETARWLLSISQAAAVGGPGSLFVPGISEKVGISGAIGAFALAIALYALAMYYIRGIKNDN